MSHVVSVLDGASTTCGNCGATLHGRFCHACGQKLGSAEVRLHDLFHEALHEITHLDGKILQTLRLLLTKPGMLTLEFLSGRRARYLSPLRLYLTCSVLFFGVAAVAPDVSSHIITIHYSPSPGEAPLAPAVQQQWEADASARAGRAIIHDGPRVMFVLMPVFGILTWLFYRKARPFYAAHLYYSIHFHALAFLALTLTVPLFSAGLASVARLVPLVIFAYHFPSLRRVFGGSRFQTAWKGTLIWFAYVFVLVLAMIAVGLRDANRQLPGAPAAESGHAALRRSAAATIVMAGSAPRCRA